MIDSELYEYWSANGLDHLPLEATTLDEVGQHIDPQQYNMIKEGWPGTILACTQLDEAAFNKLVFIKNEETLQITAGDRSLLGVTTVISHAYPNLEDLFKLNTWFEDVHKIYRDFKYSKFGYLVLRIPTYKNEKDESNGGSCYLEGGNHRSLALAIKMNLERYKFEPVKAIVLLQPPAQRATTVETR